MDAHQSIANMIGTAHAANKGKGLSHRKMGEPADGHHSMYDVSTLESANHTDKVIGWK